MPSSELADALREAAQQPEESEPTPDLAPEPEAESPAPEPEPTPEPVPEPADETPPEEPPEQTPEGDLFEAAEKMGLGWVREKYADEDALRHGMLHAMRKIGERDEDANYGRQFREHEAQFRQFLQAQTQPQAPEPEPSAPQPDFDERLLAWLERDEHGLLKPNEHSPPGFFNYEMLQRAEQHLQRVQQKRQSFESFDPEKLAEEAQKRAEEVVEQRLRAQAEQDKAIRLIEQRASEPWFFARDASGRNIIDPVSGNPVLSQQGHAYMQNAQIAYERYGISDPEGIDGYARAMAMQSPPNQQQPQPTHQEPARPAIPPGGVHKRNQSAGEPPPPPEDDKPLSLREMLRQSNDAARARGEITAELRP